MIKLVYLFITILAGCLFSFCETESATETPGEVPAVIRSTGHPAIDKLSVEIVAHPQDARLYAMRAELFYENEGYDEAINDLNKALSLDSSNVHYLHLLADAQMDYYQSREGLETMKRAAEHYPQRIPTLLKLSEFQLILKQYREALETIGQILQLDPQNAEGFFMSGLIFKEQGDIPRALNSFQTAIEIEPELIDGWIELGILFDQRNNEMALQYLDNAVRLDSFNIDAFLAKGNYHLNREQYPEAIEAYQHINRIDVQFAPAYFNIGIAQLELGNLAQAHQHFDIAVSMDPTYALAYYYRGLAARQQGNERTAKSDFEQALRFDPGLERAKAALEQSAGK